MELLNAGSQLSSSRLRFSESSTSRGSTFERLRHHSSLRSRSALTAQTSSLVNPPHISSYSLDNLEIIVHSHRKTMSTTSSSLAPTGGNWKLVKHELSYDTRRFEPDFVPISLHQVIRTISRVVRMQVWSPRRSQRRPAKYPQTCVRSSLVMPPQLLLHILSSHETTIACCKSAEFATEFALASSLHALTALAPHSWR